MRISEVLKKLADFYDVTVDYFIADNDSEPVSQITDKVLFEKFTKINNFSAEEKKVIIELLDAFIAKHEKRLF